MFSQNCGNLYVQSHDKVIKVKFLRKEEFFKWEVTFEKWEDLELSASLHDSFLTRKLLLLAPWCDLIVRLHFAR